MTIGNTWVYAVQLDDSIRESEAETLANVSPHHDPGERFQIHKEDGPRSSSYVQKFGLHLRPDLSACYNPCTELEAFRKDRRLARVLRKCGFTVAGGH